MNDKEKPIARKMPGTPIHRRAESEIRNFQLFASQPRQRPMAIIGHSTIAKMSKKPIGPPLKIPLIGRVG
jgi:hypothetical protein